MGKEGSELKVLDNNLKLCFSCMEEHNVDIVELVEKTTFKGVEVEFLAIYEYCSNSDEYLETEDMIRKNDLAVKDAYRKKVGLLTSFDIIKIREKYNISQKEFSEVLDWGKATITRYENHQVQDRAHDDILRKIDSDPKWFLEMLERAKSKISPKRYARYYRIIKDHIDKKDNPYVYNSINSKYNYGSLSFAAISNMFKDRYKSPVYKPDKNCENQYSMKSVAVQGLNVNAA